MPIRSRIGARSESMEFHKTIVCVMHTMRGEDLFLAGIWLRQSCYCRFRINRVIWKTEAAQSCQSIRKRNGTYSNQSFQIPPKRGRWNANTAYVSYRPEWNIAPGKSIRQPRSRHGIFSDGHHGLPESIPQLWPVPPASCQTGRCGMREDL
jgi:hypothetical protein